MAKKFYKITGVKESMTNINKMLAGVENKTMGGLLAGAQYIRDDMDKTPPHIPNSTGSGRKKKTGKSGDLERSWQAKPFALSKVKPMVEAGFNIRYATWVHERYPGGPWGAGIVGDINWTKDNSGAKFLELALKRAQANGNVTKTVANYVAIKK